MRVTSAGVRGMAASYSGIGTSKSLLRRMFSDEVAADEVSWLKVTVLRLMFIRWTSWDLHHESLAHRQDAAAHAEENDLVPSLLPAGAVVQAPRAFGRAVHRSTVREEEEPRACVVRERAELQPFAWWEAGRLAATAAHLGEGPRGLVTVRPRGPEPAQSVIELLGGRAHYPSGVVPNEARVNVVADEREDIGI